MTIAKKPRMRIGEPTPDDRLPPIPMRQLQQWNEDFRKAMLSAIAEGSECVATTISTSPGTRRPTYWQPPD